jgi:hypothetical protein
VLVWTVFDEEGEIIRELLARGHRGGGAVGKQSDDERADLIAASRTASSRS